MMEKIPHRGKKNAFSPTEKKSSPNMNMNKKKGKNCGINLEQKYFYFHFLFRIIIISPIPFSYLNRFVSSSIAAIRNFIIISVVAFLLTVSQ